MTSGVSTQRVLVTGASGFIGGKLSRRLVEEGRAVRCQYRRSTAPDTLKDLEARGAELIRLDLAPPAENRDAPNVAAYQKALSELMAGVDLVYHVAALTSDWGPRERFEQANVRATVALADAAAASGVKRLVCVSSVSVHGFGPHRNTTEEGPYYPPTHFYQDTKRRAEQIALSKMRDGFEVCAIRPGNVYGPDDTTMIFPMFDAIGKGIMGTVGGGRALTPPVFITDMIDALVAAGTRGAVVGEAVNVTGGEEITWREFVDLAADALGAKRPRTNLPVWIAWPAALILNRLWAAAGAENPPPLTPYRIKQVSNDFHFDISKARRVLGYEPKIRCTDGLKAAAESYKNR